MWGPLLKITSLKTYLGRNTVQCHLTLRRYAGKKYSQTLHLPKTQFPLSMKESFKEELNIQKVCGFDQLYRWQQNELRSKTFTLHDGPPYANGNPHVGHALNKIVKDITNRYKLMRGFKVNYQPGWDCHGMPIEQKALSRIKSDYNELDPKAIRKISRTFAEETIATQMAAFRRWGVMADWENCYYTFSKEFETEQLNVFFKMYEKGLIYKAYMPVYWSPTARTSLAEAELEYKDDHVSTSVFARFPLTTPPPQLADQTDGRPVHLVVWTTTPWTLPLNKAICFSPNIQYSLVQFDNDLYVIATNCVDLLATKLGKQATVITSFEGWHLEGCTYNHPLRSRDGAYPVLAANHVATDIGTGLVHTAPAHGTQDFQVAVNNNMSVECLVNESGAYIDGVHPALTGKQVLTEGSTTALELLGDDILHSEPMTHSYPYDWRTKTPCIYRASRQWFVSTDKIKQRALDCLAEVRVLPETSGGGMRSMLERRSYWCISRQRAWGVPIPVFTHAHTGEVLLNRHSVTHILNLVSEHGSDCWWDLPLDVLLPAHVKQQSGYGADEEFEKGADVLDIWFDSGSSWASALKETGLCSDVYLEGLDQFGGWFQSSLLTSVAVQDKAPYRQLVVHGFAVDEEGRKMSKSLGNVVDPDVIVNGNKKRKEPAYGADVLRWWAASVGLDRRVQVGAATLQRCQDQIFAARKMLRHLLGSVSDFQAIQCVAYRMLPPTDRYMLYLLHQLYHQVCEHYDAFRYDQALRQIDLFITTSVSAFYTTVTKDRAYCSEPLSLDLLSCQTVQFCMLESITQLQAPVVPHLCEQLAYCSEPLSLDLLSCQTVQFRLLESITQLLAPVVPHLCEQLYQYPPLSRPDIDSIFKTTWTEPDPQWYDPDLAHMFSQASHVRELMNKVIHPDVPNSCDVTLSTTPAMLNQLIRLQPSEESQFSSLCELLQASRVRLCPLEEGSEAEKEINTDSEDVRLASTWLTGLDGSEHACLLRVERARDHICERCRRYTAATYGTPCSRCMEAMSSNWQ